MVTNIVSKFLVSPFSNNHKFPFESTHSCYGFKRLVLSAKKNSGHKNSGALCQAIWDLTQSPSIFSESRLKFNTCVDINFGVQSAMKKHPCTWMESALMWRRDRDKHTQSSIKKYKSQCIGNLTMEFAIQIFSIMDTRIFEYRFVRGWWNKDFLDNSELAEKTNVFLVSACGGSSEGFCRDKSSSQSSNSIPTTCSSPSAGSVLLKKVKSNRSCDTKRLIRAVKERN